MPTVRQTLAKWDGEPAPKTNTVKAWSYSALYWYELCPYRYYLERIEKRPTKSKAYFEKGNRTHKAAEAYVRGNGAMRPLPGEIKHNREFIAEVARFTGGHRVIEQQWGFTNSWKPTDWMGDHTWFRMVLDYGIEYDASDEAEIVDWKTGRKWASNADEMEIFATGFLHRRPHINTVTTRLVYFDSNDQSFQDFHRRDLPAMTDKWATRAQALFDEQDWRPRPNARCKGCDFSKSEGGPCRYG